MSGRGALKDLSAWVEKGKDLYVISVTNAIFPSPEGFVFFGTQHFFYQMRAYLGPTYQCCGMSESATGDGTIVICREELRAGLSDVTTQAMTRVGKATDADWLQRVARASRAHSHVARSKSVSRLENMGPSMGSPKRRGTVEIRKELTQIGNCASFSFGSGPELHFVNMWDAASSVPESDLKRDRFVLMGQFMKSGLTGEPLCEGEKEEDGSIRVYNNDLFPVAPFVSNVESESVQLPCEGALEEYDPDGEDELDLDVAIQGDVASPEKDVVDLETSSGTHETLTAIRASLEVAHSTKAGVVHVNDPVRPKRSGSVLVPASGGGNDPAPMCCALRSTFNIAVEPLMHIAVPGVVELYDLELGEFANPKQPPSKLTLEVTSSATNDEKFTTDVSDDGRWKNACQIKVWTDQLRFASLAVSVTGFASSSSLGGFFSSITGTSQSLGVTRIPLYPILDETNKDGSFSVPVYSTTVQEVSSTTVYGRLSGKIRKLKE
jgi:hypothetical protein